MELLFSLLFLILQIIFLVGTYKIVDYLAEIVQVLNDILEEIKTRK